MKYEFRDNLKEKKKGENRLVALGVILSIMCVTFPFVGCSSSKVGQVKTVCHDGWLYTYQIGKKKEIVRENRAFVPCESGSILRSAK